MLEQFALKVEQIKSGGGRLFFLGVGGSAANASHAVNDFRKILNIESYAITDNVSELTARINDEGWPTSFIEWLKVSKLSSNDGVVVFSVGGGSDKTSQNIVKALEYAKQRGSTVLSVVSRDGGASKKLSDVCILIEPVAEARITPHAEEFQGIVWHLIVSYLREKQ
jgi:D-sedoheptulose 7-phosphate isomerase